MKKFHTEEVAGSIPASPTRSSNNNALQYYAFRYFDSILSGHSVFAWYNCF